MIRLDPEDEKVCLRVARLPEDERNAKIRHFLGMAATVAKNAPECVAAMKRYFEERGLKWHGPRDAMDSDQRESERRWLRMAARVREIVKEN